MRVRLKCANYSAAAKILVFNAEIGAAYRVTTVGAEKLLLNFTCGISKQFKIAIYCQCLVEFVNLRSASGVISHNLSLIVTRRFCRTFI